MARMSLDHDFGAGRAIRAGALACLLLASACAAPLPPAAAEPPARAGATEVAAITLEQDCFGCATGSLLVLRSDGTASLTITGKARHGTQDQLLHGTVRSEDFDALARQALQMGFMGLDEIYQDPQIGDGAWTTTGLQIGVEEKRVFRRHDAGPPALQSLESAIEAVKARIQFRP